MRTAKIRFELEQELEDKNRLIAEFMGFRPVRCKNGFAWDNNKIIKPISLHGNLVDTGNNGKFHSSWDWLMPVVKKIENLGFEVIIVGNGCTIKHNSDSSIEVFYFIETSSKLEATYLAILSFIKFNNPLTQN